jgi:large subunit ribosomal protein L31
MKEGIHPDMKKIEVKCACGNTFETLSTKEDLHVDVCSECHPFFSEGDRFLDSEGRISKFEKKYGIESDEAESEEGEEEGEETEAPDTEEKDSE